MELKLVQQTPTDLNQEALDDFIENRVQMKKPMTPMAIKKAQNFLLKYPYEHQQFIVDHAILSGWRGLYHVDMPERSSRSISLHESLTDTSWAN